MYVNYMPVLRPIFIAVKLICSCDHFFAEKGEKKVESKCVCESEEMTFPLK